MRLLTLGLVIFAIGATFAYILAERYVNPILAVADAAQNIAARGLEPIPEARRHDEIGLLTRSFNDMLTQLRRARERELELNRLERFTALGQLAGALAHEVKNPLNFISLALDQLVDSVLALSESKLKSQGIEVVEQGGNVPAMLNVDAEKLRLCFVNVVANATQAMPDGGRLDVGFVRDDGKFLVSFSDTGKGIDPQVVEHVFEPFFTTKREGIGLGLFFSKAIVEKHGGAIAIGPNDPPPGTKVTFAFPLGTVNK